MYDELARAATELPLIIGPPAPGVGGDRPRAGETAKLDTARGYLVEQDSRRCADGNGGELPRGCAVTKLPPIVPSPTPGGARARDRAGVVESGADPREFHLGRHQHRGVPHRQGSVAQLAVRVTPPAPCRPIAR